MSDEEIIEEFKANEYYMKKLYLTNEYYMKKLLYSHSLKNNPNRSAEIEKYNSNDYKALSEIAIRIFFNFKYINYAKKRIIIPCFIQSVSEDGTQWLLEPNLEQNKFRIK